jgi:hypothetical protein
MKLLIWIVLTFAVLGGQVAWAVSASTSPAIKAGLPVNFRLFV